MDDAAKLARLRELFSKRYSVHTEKADKVEERQLVRALQPPLHEQPLCLHCNEPLRRFPYRFYEHHDLTAQWGDYGDNQFCGKTCGHKWACDIASALFVMGTHRLVRRKDAS